MCQPKTTQMHCVLVTGGAGFIGSATAYQLLLRGDKVVVVDELNDYYNVKQKQANLSWLIDSFGTERCKIYIADIADKAHMRSLFEKEGITRVCNLAARAGVRPSIDDPFIYVHSNVVGTLNLLELSRQFGVENFVYASSSSVYGGSTNEVFSEKDVTVQPVSQYAATKMSCELMAHTYHHLYGMNCTGLRFFTVYGPRGRPDMAPFKFVERISQGRAIDMYGDGTTERDYTYIDDIVDGVIRSLDRPLGYQVFNLGCEQPVQLKTFINTIEEQLGKKAIINQMEMQPGDVPRTSADVSHARKLLDYQPKTSLAVGLGHFCKWYESAMKDGFTAGADILPLCVNVLNRASSVLVTTHLSASSVSDVEQCLADLDGFAASAVKEGHDAAVAVVCDSEDDLMFVRRIEDTLRAHEGKAKCIYVMQSGPQGLSATFNALLSHAAHKKCDTIMYSNPSYPLDPKELQLMQQHLTDDTLVVGAAQPTRHMFNEGSHPLTSFTGPNNLFALWSVPKLSLTGFLAVNDGLIDGVEAGGEELSVAAMHQHLKPNQSKVKLLQMPGNNAWARDESVESNLVMPAFCKPSPHLSSLGVANAVVQHIIC